MKKQPAQNARVLLSAFKDRNAVSIHDHSVAAPMLLVLLRHVGCSFCRKALHELSVSMKHITGCGYRVGLVHMDSDEDMQIQLAKFGLEKLPRFHDPDRKLYRALGVKRAPIASLFDFKMWQEGVAAKRLYGADLPKADPFQLPGAFLIDQGVIVAGESVLSPHEHPDFLALLIRSEAVAAA